MYDAIARVLVALAPTTGGVEWRFGRPGRGPHEFGGAATLHAEPGGGLFVLDHGNMRMVAISEDGNPGDRTSYSLGANPRGVCHLRRGELRLSARIDKELECVRDDLPRPVVRVPPWPDLAGQPSLVRQAKVCAHPRGEVCLLTHSFGPSFALDDDDGTRAVGVWIEDVPRACAYSSAKGS